MRQNEEVSTPPSTRTRGRGRPPRIDPDAVAHVALDLFVTRGVTSVPMTEVAATAGVSRRSLFRLFPSKAALVWAGMEEADTRFTTAFDRETEATDPLLDRIRSAYVSALAPLDTAPEVTRRRMLLIDENPDIYAWGIPLLRRFEAHLMERITDARPLLDELVIRSMASAIAASAFAAIVWWAHQGGSHSIRDVVDQALGALSDL